MDIGMKFCENCGAQLQDNDQFCEKCGQTVSDFAQLGNEQFDSMQQQNMQPENLQQENMQFNKKPVQTHKKGLIAVIIGVVLLACGIAVFMIYQNIKRQVNVNDYITINYEGFSGVGTAECSFDYKRLYQDIIKAGGKNKFSNLSAQVDSDADLSVLAENISIQLDKKTNLSNGDKIKITIECNEMLKDFYQVKFRYEDAEYTVENLEEAKEIDLFANISVSFNGTNGSATVSVENNAADSYIKALTFRASKTSKISVGDEITVSCKVDTEEALKSGYIIKETSKNYKCEKLDSYIADLADIPSTALENIKKDVQDVIESYIAQNDYLTAEDYSYVGAYTLIPKSSSYSLNNLTYVIFSAKVTSSKKTSEQENTKTVYFPVSVRNILQKVDGSTSYEKGNIRITGSCKVGSSYVTGYTDGSAMYKELITAQKDRYTYKVSGDAAQFGE